MKSYFVMALVAAGIGLAGCNSKSDTPSAETAAAGGERPASTGTIFDMISASPTHRALAEAVAQAGLAQTLSGAGPFTLFAPTDEAFNQVAPVTRDDWLRAEHKDALAGILRYHVVPGKLTVADLKADIAENGGEIVLKTLGGQNLTVRINGNSILLTSSSGNKAIVTQADLGQSNGVIHIVDAVLIPAM